RTLVLVLSTNCKFCKMSAPFYSELAGKVSRDHSRRVVAIFPQAPSDVAQFKLAQNLACETIPDVPITEAGISATPTMLLVGSDGIVIQSWTGAPNEQTKQAITSALMM